MTTNPQIPEALADALAHVIADERAQWARERELIEAQAKASLAELRAEVANLRAEIAGISRGARSVGALATAAGEVFTEDQLQTLADVVANERGQWRQDLAKMAAEAREAIAGIHAAVKAMAAAVPAAPSLPAAGANPGCNDD